MSLPDTATGGLQGQEWSRSLGNQLEDLLTARQMSVRVSALNEKIKGFDASNPSPVEYGSYVRFPALLLCDVSVESHDVFANDLSTSSGRSDCDELVFKIEPGPAYLRLAEYEKYDPASRRGDKQAEGGPAVGSGDDAAGVSAGGTATPHVPLLTAGADRAARVDAMSEAARAQALTPHGEAEPRQYVDASVVVQLGPGTVEPTPEPELTTPVPAIQPPAVSDELANKRAAALVAAEEERRENNISKVRLTTQKTVCA